MFPEEHHAGIGGLFVGSDGDEGLFVAGDVELGTGTGILNGFAAVEVFVDFGFHGVDVDVANNDDGLEVGTIPIVVEAGDDRAFEGADDFFKADGETVGIFGAFEHDGPSGFAEAFLGTETATPLFEDDATLVFDFVLFKEELGSPAVEDFETHLDKLFVVGREFDVVDGFVEGGPGVDATAEFDTVFLEGADHLVALVVLGAVEGHVLAEVGKTLLVVVFKDGTGVGDETELDTVFGLFVGTDVVGHAVGQFADFHFFVDRHHGGEVALLFACLLSLGEIHATDEGEEHEDG